MEELYVNIPDSNKKINKWIIDEVHDNFYDISYYFDRSVITSIPKEKVFVSNEGLYSEEVRDVKFNNGNTVFCSFIQFKI